MALRATLFDMDGLLVDSEILWHKAEVEIFGSLGVVIPQDGTRLTKGMYVAEVVDFWWQRHAWTGPSTREVVQQILQRVGDLVESEGRLLPGAERAIALCAERGPVVVASSTPIDLIRRCLDHFSLRERFVGIYSAEFEPFGKPHPGVFITAALDIDCHPKDCLVFEDSQAGVIAAKAARATCVAVPAADERRAPTFVIADLVLDSLDELSATWLDQQFGR